MSDILIIDINRPDEFLLNFCSSKKRPGIDYNLLHRICNMRPNGQGTTTKGYFSCLKHLAKGRGVVVEAIIDMQQGRGELTDREQETLHSLGIKRWKTVFLLAKMQQGRGMITPDEYQKLADFCYSPEKDGIRSFIFEGMCILYEGKGMMNDMALFQIQSLCTYQGTTIDTELLTKLARERRGYGIPIENGVWYEDTKTRFKFLKDKKAGYSYHNGQKIKKTDTKEDQDVEELFGGNIFHKLINSIKKL